MWTAMKRLIVAAGTDHAHVPLVDIMIMKETTGHLGGGRVAGKIGQETMATANVSLKENVTDGGGKTMHAERPQETGAGVVVEYFLLMLHLMSCIKAFRSRTSDCDFHRVRTASTAGDADLACSLHVQTLTSCSNICC